MADYQEVDANIKQLANLIPSGMFSSDDWDFKTIWTQIKETGNSFKGCRYPSKEEHEAAWNRFQSLVDQVKDKQSERQKNFANRADQSAQIRDRLIRQSESAVPSDSGLFDFVATIATGGLYMVGKMALDAIMGEYDQQKEDLKSASSSLKSVWNDFSSEKKNLLRDDKDLVFKALSVSQDQLNAAWESYKRDRQHAYEQYQNERNELKAEKQARHEAWKDKTRARISKNEDWLDNLRSRLDKQRDHLSDLESKKADAWNDTFRDRVDDWINEAESSIKEIEEKITRVRGFISEDRDKLNSSW